MQSQKSLRNTLYIRIFTPYILIILITLGVFFYFQGKLKLCDELVTSSHSLADIAYQQQVIAEKYNIGNEELKNQIIQEFETNNTFLNMSLVNFKKDMILLFDQSENHELEIIENEVKNFVESVHLLKSGESIDSQSLLDTAENIYLSVLKLSDSVLREKRSLRSINLYINVTVLFIFSVIAFFLTRSTVESVLFNLGHVENFAKKFSIKSITNSLEKKHDEFLEISSLKNSIIIMKEKVLLETRLAQQENTSKTIGELAENLAHLINNPLAIIATSARILTKKVKDNELVQEEAESIQVCVDRITDTSLSMKKLINSESKDVVSSFSIINLRHGVELFFLNKFLENNIHLDFDLGADHKVFARENEILQALFSLVENAIDHIIRNELLVEKWIKISSEKINDKDIIISIEDCGVNADDNSIYSSMMSQNDKSVGLYSVSQVINKNLGSIEFISKPNTKFSITLPSKSIFDS